MELTGLCFECRRGTRGNTQVPVTCRERPQQGALPGGLLPACPGAGLLAQPRQAGPVPWLGLSEGADAPTSISVT